MERWRQIPIMPLYEASDLGNVRMIGKFKPLTPTADKDGYRRVYGRGISRLVCSAFHGEAPSGKNWALHKNGDNTDDTPSNLYWGSPQDNSNDRVSHGNSTHKHKTAGNLNKIREAAKTMTQQAVAEMFGIHQTTVSLIVRKARKYEED